jgi:hypothetical protein
MDEEELEQPSSKINLGSFFERVDSVEKVANNALSRANANLGIISNQKLIINSLNVTIEAMETKIRDIANYIIIEKKVEKDVEEDRALEEQDRLQKQAMVERATTIMGEPGPQGEPGQPAEKQQGSSLLGTLLRLGIGAFAIKFLWPAILPALKGVLAGVLKSVFSWTGLKLAGLLGGIIGSIPLIGKYGPKIKDGIVDTFSGISSWVENLVKGVDKDGRVSDGAGGGTGNPTNLRGSGQRQPLLEGDESMRNTLSEKDLMVTPGTRIDEYGAEGGGKPSSGDLSMFNEEDSENIEEKPESDINSMENRKERARQQIEVFTEKYNNTSNARLKNAYRRKINEAKEFLKEGQFSIESQFPQVEQYDIDIDPNKNIPKQVYEGMGFVNNVDGDMTQAIAKTNERIDNLIGAENKEQNSGNLVSANKPNVTEATLKVAAAPLPFVKVIKNNQLSTSPKSYNGLPPEIAAMIS